MRSNRRLEEAVTQRLDEAVEQARGLSAPARQVLRAAFRGRTALHSRIDEGWRPVPCTGTAAVLRAASSTGPSALTKAMIGLLGLDVIASAERELGDALLRARAERSAAIDDVERARAVCSHDPHGAATLHRAGVEVRIASERVRVLAEAEAWLIHNGRGLCGAT
jgi:hypothetical protein